MRYRANRAFEAQMRRDPRVKRAQAAKCREVKRLAELFAPKSTGSYARSIREDGESVGTEDPAGHLVEFGSANNTAYAPLRRAARAAGLRFKEAPKR